MDWLRRMGFAQRPVVPADLEDVPGTSLLAIKRRRSEAGCELRARVYLYDGRQFIISPVMSAPGSVILEVGQPLLLPLDIADADLGSAVCATLLRHDARTPPDLRGHTAADWPAYQASRARSVTRFEEKSWAALVETHNTVLEIEAAPLRTLKPGLAVKATVQPDHAEVGALLRRAFAGAKALRDAGMV
jgi:hypothetical protein